MKKDVDESPVLQAIFQRRSVRQFEDAPVDRDLIIQAVKAASWAPSGTNNQPWRFSLIRQQELKASLAGLTRYAATLKSAAWLVVVFLDKEASYDYTKDCQAVGACIQNMLLALHSFDLGAVWIGEILKNKNDVLKALSLPERLELMAVVAVGHPAHRKQSSHRQPIEELIVLEK